MNREDTEMGDAEPVPIRQTPIFQFSLPPPSIAKPMSHSQPPVQQRPPSLNDQATTVDREDTKMGEASPLPILPHRPTCPPPFNPPNLPAPSIVTQCEKPMSQCPISPALFPPILPQQQIAPNIPGIQPLTANPQTPVQQRPATPKDESPTSERGDTDLGEDEEILIPQFDNPVDGLHDHFVVEAPLTEQDAEKLEQQQPQVQEQQQMELEQLPATEEGQRLARDQEEKQLCDVSMELLSESFGEGSAVRDVPSEALSESSGDGNAVHDESMDLQSQSSREGGALHDVPMEAPSQSSEEVAKRRSREDERELGRRAQLLEEQQHLKEAEEPTPTVIEREAPRRELEKAEVRKRLTRKRDLQEKHCTESDSEGLDIEVAKFLQRKREREEKIRLHRERQEQKRLDFERRRALNLERYREEHERLIRERQEKTGRVRWIDQDRFANPIAQQPRADKMKVRSAQLAKDPRKSTKIESAEAIAIAIPIAIPIPKEDKKPRGPSKKIRTNNFADKLSEEDRKRWNEASKQAKEPNPDAIEEAFARIRRRELEAEERARQLRKAKDSDPNENMKDYVCVPVVIEPEETLPVIAVPPVVVVPEVSRTENLLPWLVGVTFLMILATSLLVGPLATPETTPAQVIDSAVEQPLPAVTDDMEHPESPMAGFQGACAAVGMQGMRRVGQWLRRNLTL
jgi:hypothetical protein